MIFREYLKSRIARKLVIAIVAMSSALTLIATAFQLFADYKSDINQIDNFFYQIERSYLPILASSLWDFNLSQVEIGLQGILALPGVEFIEIQSEDSGVISYGTLHSRHIKDQSFPLTITNRGKTIPLGTLRVVSSLDMVYKQLLHKAVTIFISNGVKAFIVSAFIFLLVHKLVTRQLFSVLSSIRDIESRGSENDIDQTLLPSNARHLDNEFQQVLAAISQMKCGLDRAITEIRSSHTRYKNLFESSPVPLWEEDFTEVLQELQRFNVHGSTELRKILTDEPDTLLRLASMVKIIDVNKAALDLHGAGSKDELIGNLDKIFTPKSMEVFREELVALASGRKEFKSEGEVATLDGRLKFIALTLAIDTSTDKRALALLATADITEERDRKQQLLQVQKMESIGNLAGGIAHDFNNILASIIGFSEIALSEIDKDNPAYADLEEVLKAGARAKDLVRQILLFARKTDEELRPIKVRPVIEEVISFLESTTPTTITVEKNLESSSSIQGNATQLHQVVMNICTNGVHAIGNEFGRISILLEDVSTGRIEHTGLKAGPYVRLQISDSGKGIPASQLDNIFEPYFSTKNPGEGTGLGLSVAQGIVKNYGGNIYVQSTVGKGTTFTIYLPAISSRKEDPGVQSAPLLTGNERLLFVDDEVNIVNIGKRLLTSLGYSVTALSSPLEALEMFSSEPESFDLLITDMTMPEMTGDVLAAQCMKIRRDFPVIVCTGYTNRLSPDEVAAIGIRAFIFKPIAKSDLSITVRKVLDDKSLKTS